MNVLRTLSVHWILVAILVLAFMLRIAGVDYGLPLTVISDEPPFTLSALQMINTQNLIPARAPADFQNILPYPPYISYLLLLPFTIVLGFLYVVYQGDGSLFSAFLLQDLSAFFVVARSVNILFGIATIYFVYEIARKLLRSQTSGLAAAFLTATSIAHIALSSVGRNWIVVTFLITTTLYILTREWSLSRRYLAVFMLAGIGVGVSIVSSLSLVLAGIFYLLFDQKGFRSILTDAPRFVLFGAVFIALAIIPTLLHSPGNKFVVGLTLGEGKSLMAALLSPGTVLQVHAFAEPVLITFFLGGLALMALRLRKEATLIAAWFLFYVLVFFFVFRFEPRFLVPLVPFYSIAGGYFVSRLWGGRRSIAVVLMLLIPFVTSAFFASLMRAGDTRDLARTWALENLSAEDKIITYGYEVRLPLDSESLEELRALGNTPRKIDEAEALMDRKDIPHALNVYATNIESSFFKDPSGYAKNNGYRYVLYAPERSNDPTSSAAMIELTRGARKVASWKGSHPTMSMSDSAFTAPFIYFFFYSHLGPPVTVYELRP